jgi:hypothetical protein
LFLQCCVSNRRFGIIRPCPKTSPLRSCQIADSVRRKMKRLTAQNQLFVGIHDSVAHEICTGSAADSWSAWIWTDACRAQTSYARDHLRIRRDRNRFSSVPTRLRQEQGARSGLFLDCDSCVPTFLIWTASLHRQLVWLF